MTDRQFDSPDAASRSTGLAPANHGIAPESYFLSCDWGTSSFRLRLIETHTLQVIGELKNNEGIAATFQLWLNTQKPASERLAFYRSALETQIAVLQACVKDNNGPCMPPFNFVPITPVTDIPASVSLSGVPSLSGVSAFSGIPLLISGMASSSIGMQELPYKELPFNTSGEDLQVAIFEATILHPHETLLISGVRSIDDVMRGEETQLIGCFSLPSPGQAHTRKGQENTECLFIFPGTHSKHVRVRAHQVVGFRTYMTGEYFHLLTKYSILAGSVAESIGPTESIAPTTSATSTPGIGFIPSSRPTESPVTPNPFEQGVLDSLDTNLLHQSFQVRTHHLLGTMSKEDNYHYLSGLLIGSECKDLIGTCQPITLVSGGDLLDHYRRALQTLAITGVQIQDLEQAVIEAHARLCKSFLGK